MQFKLFVGALLGACVFQVAFADLASRDDLEDPGLIAEAINKATETINNVTSLIKNKVNDGLNTLNSLKDQVIKQVNQATEAGEKQLKDIIANSNEDIKELIAKADKLGIAISECVANSTENFEQLLKTVLANEVSCVTNELDAAVKSITDAVTAVQNGVNAIIKFPDNLAACNNSIMCNTRLIYEVGMIQMEVPAKIGKTIAEITQQVNGLQIRLEICTTTELAEAGVECAKIVATDAICALEKGVGRIK